MAISTLFYIVIVWIALISVPRDELAAARAPLSLAFERVTGGLAISAIAIVATINGIIALIVMASRVIYGMADRDLLPAVLAAVSPLTRTPLNATALVVVAVLVLAVVFPLGWKTVANVWAIAIAVMAILFWLMTKDDPQLEARRRSGAKPEATNLVTAAPTLPAPKMPSAVRCGTRAG